MITCCYTTDDAQPPVTVERQYPSGKSPKKVKISGGRWAYRDIVAEQRGMKPNPGIWPMHSDFAGVHPNQCQEAYDHSVRNGVPTEFDKTGAAIFTSRKHRKDYLRIAGLYDRNAGYGDAAPRNR